MNGVTTKYFIEGDRIVLEKVGNEERAFWYDGEGKAAAFVIYDSTGMHPYYYIRNGQGDVIGLFDASGNIVARYTYDSWGNLLSIKDGSGNDKTNDTTFVGYKNPLRYRGYYYDSETKLYYLQSRYYNPEWGRFINADGIITGNLVGSNLFTYCYNNPIIYDDQDGRSPRHAARLKLRERQKSGNPVTCFFDPSTNAISGTFQEGILRGSGSLIGGYSEFNGRLQANSKNGNNNTMLGGFGKVSVGNASGKIGIGNNDAAFSIKGVADGLTATAQAGIQYKDGAGLAAKAKASVLSGRATAEFELFGWQIEFGVSGDVLSAGAEAMVGVFPDEGFTAKASVGAGLFGGGFIFRIKPDQ